MKPFHNQNTSADETFFSPLYISLTLTEKIYFVSLTLLKLGFSETVYRQRGEGGGGSWGCAKRPLPKICHTKHISYNDLTLRSYILPEVDPKNMGIT